MSASEPWGYDERWAEDMLTAAITVLKASKKNLKRGKTASSVMSLLTVRDIIEDTLAQAPAVEIDDEGVPVVRHKT